jgi:hypothetical protein
VSTPDWLTSTQTEFPISHGLAPFCASVLFFFCFRLGDRGCENTLNFDAVGPKARRERVLETESRFGGSGIGSFAVRVGEDGRAFVERVGEVGALDKGDGEDMKMELRMSSLRSGTADALRLREVVATAGSLPLAACDGGAGVRVDFFGLSGFLSGDEELPLSGEERCFPVAV